jgi:hypothetical protein
MLQSLGAGRAAALHGPILDRDDTENLTDDNTEKQMIITNSHYRRRGHLEHRPAPT